jgi:hypothetical protein
MNTLSRLLLALLAAVLLTVLAVWPAAACSVVAGKTEKDHRDAAELVFTGTAVRVDDPTNGAFYSSADPLYWTFVVDAVEKGDMPARMTVATAITGASCGYTFELGKRYRVYAGHSDHHGHLATGLGSGNRVLPALADAPRVEGEFHTVEYHVRRLGPVVLPGVALIGVGLWVVRRRSR